MSRFLLACDVGNSRTKYGLFQQTGDLPASGKRLSCLYAIAVHRDDIIDWTPFQEKLAIRQIESGNVTGVIAGSHPEGVMTAQSSWPRDWADEPFVIEKSSKLPVEIRLQQPDKVGIDRLLNAVEVNAVRAENVPAIIIDSGTATTVDALDDQGAFLGGAILPGFQMAARALNHYTALLPLIEIEDLASGSHHPIGDDTCSALRSGLFWGQLGAVRELISQISHSLSEKCSTTPELILTGGGGPLLKPHLPSCRWEPHLALEGLAYVGENLLS